MKNIYNMFIIKIITFVLNSVKIKIKYKYY